MRLQTIEYERKKKEEKKNLEKWEMLNELKKLANHLPLMYTRIVSNTISNGIHDDDVIVFSR